MSAQLHSDCQWSETEEGKQLCLSCGYETRRPAKCATGCAKQSPYVTEIVGGECTKVVDAVGDLTMQIPGSEIRALGLPDHDPTLLGNIIAKMTSAIGVPPCGGCKSRQEWLNRAHQWVRSALSSSPEQQQADQSPQQDHQAERTNIGDADTRRQSSQE